MYEPSIIFGVSFAIGILITGFGTYMIFKWRWNTITKNAHISRTTMQMDNVTNRPPNVITPDRDSNLEYISPLFSESLRGCHNIEGTEENPLYRAGSYLTMASPTISPEPIRLPYSIEMNDSIESQKPSASCNVSEDLRAQIVEFANTSKREIRRNMFEVGEQIGKGNFGKVYKGNVIGMYHDTSKTAVAIKSISGQVTEAVLENMLSEIKIMSKIRPHLNLVSMIASCSTDFDVHRNLWLILEFCEHSDLKNILKLKTEELLSGEDNGVINHRCLIKWAFDIANGMQYLVENKIMHGDLAARNILMDENPVNGGYPVAKVADFGLSKELNDYLIYEKQSRLHVPWRWMALEFLTRNYFTITSDVWSFGVLFWEILSCGRTPYGHQGYDELMIKLQSGYRLGCPDGLDDITSWSPLNLFNKVSELCFVADPSTRGRFSDVVEVVKKELTKEEILFYGQMQENYHTTRSKNYLRLNIKTRAEHENIEAH